MKQPLLPENGVDELYLRGLSKPSSDSSVHDMSSSSK
jgi:hypothetical protein